MSVIYVVKIAKEKLSRQKPLHIDFTSHSRSLLGSLISAVDGIKLQFKITDF